MGHAWHDVQLMMGLLMAVLLKVISGWLPGCSIHHALACIAQARQVDRDGEDGPCLRDSWRQTFV